MTSDADREGRSDRPLGGGGGADPPGVTESGVAAQWAAVSAWLESSDAMAAARAALARRNAFGVRPEEIVGEAWLRLRVTFDQRAGPYPTWDDAAPARLAVRAMDSALVDLLRRAAVRRATPIASIAEPSVRAATDRIERVEAFRDVVAAINALGKVAPGCRGCAPDVVMAAALAVVHHAAAGTELPGRGDYFSRLVGRALTEVAGDVSGAALRQRRRRCGPCVRMLVERAMRVAGMDMP